MASSLNDIFELLIDALAARVQDRIGIATIKDLRPPDLAKARLMTVKQAAIYIGRSENAVRALRVSGRLRVTKLDNRLQFDREDLDRFIDNSKL